MQRSGRVLGSHLVQSPHFPKMATEVLRVQNRAQQQQLRRQRWQHRLRLPPRVPGPALLLLAFPRVNIIMPPSLSRVSQVGWWIPWPPIPYLTKKAKIYKYLLITYRLFKKSMFLLVLRGRDRESTQSEKQQYITQGPTAGPPGCPAPRGTASPPFTSID